MTTKRHADNHLMLERLMNIHAKIKSGCYPSAKQLAFELEVSLSTINRDIEFLKDRFNAPIVYDAKQRGIFYSEDYDMPLNMISPDDLMTLSTAKQLLSHYEGTPVFEEASRIIDFLCDTQTVGNSGFLNRIALPPSPKIIVDERIWNLIVKAMQKNLKIEFDYNGRWQTERTHRKVRPYQILLDEGRCFLFGFSEERNSERLFLLSRIKKLTLTEETFSLPKDFDFNSRCAGGKFGTFLAEDSDEFVIDFYNDGRQYVKECVWAENQKITDYDDENRTEISFVSSQGLKIREWVLSQGANARPLKPEWFVKDWKKQLEEMRKLAEK